MTRSLSVRTLLFVLGIALAVFLFGVQTAFAVGTNGSFELGTDPGSFATLPAGNTNITDWTIDSGSVDYIGTYWQASDGVRSIDLNGTAQGSISQSIPTVIGATYDVTFDLSGNPDGGPALKVLSVTSTSTSAQNFSYDTGVQANSLANMKWASSSYSFIATTTSTKLTFASTITGSFGPALDNVVIVETLPPPPPPPPPPPAGCSGGSSSSGNVSIINGISISVNQSGCITNTTSSRASTGGNSVGGSTGGNGGRGGDVRARASGGGNNTANGNNGAATAGNGGGGGAGGAGGAVVSGGATATSNTTNILNRVRIRLNIGGLPLPI